MYSGASILHPEHVRAVLAASARCPEISELMKLLQKIIVYPQL